MELYFTNQNQGENTFSDYLMQGQRSKYQTGYTQWNSGT